MNNISKNETKVIGDASCHISSSRLNNEINSITAYDQMLAPYRTNGFNCFDFPTSFGGAFLDNDGVLVINLAESKKEAFNDELKPYLNGAHYSINHVEFSWTYLKVVQSIIDTYSIQNPESAITKNISYHSIDEEKNNIIVGLKECNSVTTSFFKESVVDSPALVFEQATKEFSFCVDVRPGYTVQTVYDYGSVGFRTTWGGLPSIISAGHLFTQNGLGAYYNSICIGYSQTRTMSNCDAALVYVNTSGYSPSNDIYGTYITLGTSIPLILKNATIYKRGMATGVTDGYIDNTGTTLYYDNSPITDLVIAMPNSGNGPISASGDSGGVVYSVLDNTYGIVTGSYNTPTKSGLVFSKASNICSKFGAYRY